MVEERVQRKLAAILAADVVAYSRLMGQDETGTLERLTSLRSEVFDPTTKKYDGRVFKNTGGGRSSKRCSNVINDARVFNSTSKQSTSRPSSKVIHPPSYGDSAECWTGSRSRM